MSGAGGLGGLQVMPTCANCELCTAAAVLLASGNVVLAAAAAMLSLTACACVPGGRVRRLVQTFHRLMPAAIQAGCGALP